MERDGFAIAYTALENLAFQSAECCKNVSKTHACDRLHKIYKTQYYVESDRVVMTSTVCCY